MNIWEFLIAVVFTGVVVRIVQMRHQGGGAARADDAELAISRDEVRQLKERIQVLERVITDNHGSRELDSEIERLRDR